ncbi:MAG: tyrosine-type recombinase/integrase [Candidatus Hydrogenedentes bacterium]|nr:tyrosine-type recombinase/integrase [Candidatus Hydrogenedentota bacterium]
MNVKILVHGNSLEARKRSLDHWRVPPSTKAELLRFLSDLELGKVNRGKKISPAAQLKYLSVLKISLEYWNRPTARLSLKHVEHFDRDLSSDRIQAKVKNAPYSHSVKVSIRKALKVFLRWRLGEARAHTLAGWLDTRDQTRTPDFLAEQQVEQLLRKCRTPEQRFIIAVLFDTGARIEEFLNIRMEDVSLPNGKDNFVRITLKEEYSKTKGRTIGLYWRHSVEVVSTFIKARLAEGRSQQDPVFAGTYGATRMFLNRIGVSVLRRRVYPHLLRHSSATYYATKLNRQELCYRYGWRFSSNMPDVYISRAGMENKELDVKFTKTEISDVKDDLVKLQQETKIKDDRIAKLENSLADLKGNLKAITEILQRHPPIKALEAALRKKRSNGTTTG